MKWLVALFLALGISSAQAQSVGNTSNFVVGSAASPAYTGFGDVVTSNVDVYVGLMAYTAATRGTAVANVCFESGGADVACADMDSSATTGEMVLTSISGNTCNTTAGSENCTAKTLYNSGSHNGNLTQATVANRPVIRLDTATNRYCMFFNSSSQILTSVSSGQATQPWTAVLAADRLTNTSGQAQAKVGADNFPSSSIGFTGASGTNTPYVSGGTSLSASAGSLNQWYALIGVGNGASSFIVANSASAVSGNAGTGQFGGTSSQIQIARLLSDTYCVEEFGIVGSNVGTTTAASIASNIHTRLGSYSGF